MRARDVIHEITHRQHGLVTASQARAAGIGRSAWRHCFTAGMLQRVSPTVAVLAGAPTTEAVRALAAVLAVEPPAALCGPSALAWWALPGFRIDPLHVMRPTGEARRLVGGGRLITCRLFNEGHWAVVDGVPCSTPSRAIFDLARLGASPAKVERVLDTAWARSLVSGRSLHAMLDQLGTRGRPGIAVMRELLDARPVGYRPPESGLERRFQRVIAEDGQPPFRRQVDAGGDQWLGRMDFVDDIPLIVMIDSDRYHASVLDQARDRDQTERLEAAGFVVARFSEFDVWYRGAEVARHVRAERAALRHRTNRPVQWSPQQPAARAVA